MAWRPYFRDRLIDERPEGFSVIVPVDPPERVPLVCPICDYAMRSREDEVAYRDLKCCDRCARLWALPRRQAWEAGWRPTSDQVIAAEPERQPLSIVFEVS